MIGTANCAVKLNPVSVARIISDSCNIASILLQWLTVMFVTPQTLCFFSCYPLTLSIPLPLSIHSSFLLWPFFTADLSSLFFPSPLPCLIQYILQIDNSSQGNFQGNDVPAASARCPCYCLLLQHHRDVLYRPVQKQSLQIGSLQRAVIAHLEETQFNLSHNISPVSPPSIHISTCVLIHNSQFPSLRLDFPFWTKSPPICCSRLHKKREQFLSESACGQSVLKHTRVKQLCISAKKHTGVISTWVIAVHSH